MFVFEPSLLKNDLSSSDRRKFVIRRRGYRDVGSLQNYFNRREHLADQTEDELLLFL